MFYLCGQKITKGQMQRTFSKKTSQFFTVVSTHCETHHKTLYLQLTWTTAEHSTQILQHIEPIGLGIDLWKIFRHHSCLIG